MPDHRSPIIAAALSVPLLAASGVAAAQPDDPYEGLVVASAFAEQIGVTPGGTVWVGVRFQIQDGWHTYWPGQNDTGFGTQIEPTAPEGVQVGEPRWPAPTRYTAPGGILDHVHETAVTALLPVTAPTDAEPGTMIRLSFDLSWLVCDEVCIPGWETVTLPIAVIASPTPVGGDTAQYFVAARARVPETITDKDRVSVTWDGQAAHVRAADAKKLAFYPDEGGSLVTDLFNAGQASSDVLVLSFDSQEPVLSGVLEIHRTGGKISLLSVRSTPNGADSKP